MKCQRCGREFTNPVPEITVPGENEEIACAEWCADCNCFTVNVLRRGHTAYYVEPGKLHDPLRGG